MAGNGYLLPTAGGLYGRYVRAFSVADWPDFCGDIGGGIHGGWQFAAGFAVGLGGG